MEIKQTNKNDLIIIEVSGRIDTNNSLELASVLNNISTDIPLILDLKDLEFISSSGLRILLAKQKAVNNKKNLEIYNVPDNIMEVFETTGFTKFLTIKFGNVKQINTIKEDITNNFKDENNLSFPGKINTKLVKEGKEYYNQLIEMTYDPYKAGEEFLLKIVKENKDTEYGKKYNFKDIHSIKDFQENVPLSNYDNYEKYINEMINENKTNLITVYPINFYTKTSGTTGDPKKIPLSDKAIKENIYPTLHQYRSYIMANKNINWINNKMLNLVEISINKLENGSSFGSISSKMMFDLTDDPSSMYISPNDVTFTNLDVDSRYINSIFALMNKDLSFVFCTYLGLFVHLLTYIQSNWELLVKDIAHGTIDDSIEIPEDIKQKILKDIKPMPERAKELQNIFEKGFIDGYASKVWPKLEIIYGVGTGGFTNYQIKVRNAFNENLSIFLQGLSASEGIFTVPLNVDDSKSMPVLNSIFYEFIEENTDNSEVLTLDQLEIGKKYEIIITNLSGFYRYKMGDVAKVVGMKNKTPLFEFLYRKNNVLNATGEKTTEEALTETINNTKNELKFDIFEYSVFANMDVNPIQYTYLLELIKTPDKLDINDIENTLTKYLSKNNPVYGFKVQNKILNKIKVRLLQPETYLLYSDLRVMEGGSSAQIKPPRIITNKKHEKFFLTLCEE
ncbi:MAG: anti-sigma factor antagonist [Methanobacteriaceae archaeon]|nr:anti-sigma factor antagonist [Methanobacteriaceae archaeon]